MALGETLEADAGALNATVDLVSTFTPLLGVSYLHAAAEYGQAEVGDALIKQGLNPDVRAAFDTLGFGGHTPIFHTVNAQANHGRHFMELLLDSNAKVDVRVAGITWGKGFEWEAGLIDISLISYIQLGLLHQMQRPELDIYSNLRLLCDHLGTAWPEHVNGPNKYLQTCGTQTN